MGLSRIHVIVGVLTAFIAVTAIGGGVAMLAGVDRFPSQWLRGTPFPDYTVPAFVLAVAVGGSSLLAATTVFTGRAIGLIAAMAAGLLLAGYLVVEIVTLRQTPPGPTWIEAVYLGLGLLIFGLALYQWLAERRQPRQPPNRRNRLPTNRP
jgi:hypothetical protein